jgi:hypothetical protein
MAIDMNGAGAAQGDAAPELRTGQSADVAKNPQERRVALDVDLANFPIDTDRVSHVPVLADADYG